MSDQSLNIPHVIADRYAIEREIGRGGMAVVYFAKDLRHFRDVAIKIFRREGAEPEEGSERFLQEIKIAARLSHPNILPLHDSGDDHGLLYYVMPYVPGESLRQRLEREGALPLADALKISTDIANALAYAHSHGVIHRDIKPENILFIAGNAVVADFGIARAISAGGWDEWKLAGPAGTPAYMSPEQGRGGSRVDGRSDLYSLGCVLYEMLTGEPPFRGNTPEELVAQHAAVEPQPVHAVRPTLPRDVQQVVGRALAKHPADRFQTALQMAEALTRLQTSASGEHESRSTPAEPVPATRRPLTLGTWLRRWGGPSVIAAGLGAALLWSAGGADYSGLDTDLMLIGPMVHQDSVPARLDGEQCSRLLTRALARWEDVRSTDSRWTEDQLSRLGHAPRLKDLLAVAREGGAGRMISGELWTDARDSVKVRGVMYDTRSGSRLLREFTVSVSPDLSDLDAKFRELADSLILPRTKSPSALSGLMGTTVLAAWQAYDSGHSALLTWDLPRAQGLFSRAIALDPNFDLAYLWRAQTRSWAGERTAQWKEDVRRGQEHPERLAPDERQWARAMLALAEQRYPDACAQFNEMLRRDSLDFRAWYGRGDCRANDRVVVRDDRSPSKYSFRSSYAAAINDYVKALTLIPSSNGAFRGAAFDRLKAILFADDYMLRPGQVEGDSTIFAAFPGLQADTLAFVPYPATDLVRLQVAYKLNHPGAVRRNLEQLHRITGTWVREFPNSIAAQQAQARTFELLGQLDVAGGRPSALRAIEAARRLSTDSVEQIELAATHFRILFKAQRWAEARALADSLFARHSSDPTEAQVLPGMAVLLGRPSRATQLERVERSEFYGWYGEPVHTNMPLKEGALRLLTYAALGAPRDSVEAWHEVVQRQIRSFGQPTERSKLRSALVDHATILLPRGWGDALFNPEKEPYLFQADVRLKAKNNDTAAVRQMLTDLDEVSAGKASPWRPAPEATLFKSEVLLSMGDTAAVVRNLDLMFNATEGMNVYFVEELAQAGAIVRLMLLRVELADRMGDLPVARRWANAMTTLWANAEPGLQPMLATSKRIVAQRQ